MKALNMPFGTYIKKLRMDDPRELTLKQVSEELGISLSFLSDIENNRRKAFDLDMLETFANYLNLDSEKRDILFDLAGRNRNEVPADIVDIMMYDRIGELARFALRQSNAGKLTEDDWKAFIQKAENKREGK